MKQTLVPSTLLCLLVFIVFAAPLSLSAADSTYGEDPTRCLVDELNRRTVVMLGDFMHGAAYPYQSLMDVLEIWAADGSASRTLTLFLECDSGAADKLNRYLRTGSLGGLLDHFLPAGSLEQFEFYEDLRAVAGRLDDPSRLWVRGVEPGSIYDILEATEEETMRMFVEDRDRMIADAMLDHIRDFPDREILVFYGNGHLVTNRVRKTQVPDHYPDKAATGYFLAHYLKKALGDDEVLSVNQVIRPPGAERVRPDWPMDRDILVDWDSIPAGWPGPGPECEYDEVVVRCQTQVVSHSLRQVFCRRIVEASIRDLERVAPYEPDGFFAVRQAESARRSLGLITGEAFVDADDWRRWQAEADYDGVARLMSPELASMVRDLIGRFETDDVAAAKQLVYLGLQMKDIGGLRGKGLIARSHYWDTHRPEVLALQAVGMLWCGDDEERAWAERRLADQAGRAFATPGEALKWTRARFRSVTY